MNARVTSALAFIRGFEAMIRAMEYCSIAGDPLSHRGSAVAAVPDGEERFGGSNGARSAKWIEPVELRPDNSGK